MSLVINTNSIASTAANNLSTNQANLQRSLARLSSGSKIVIPADDAGGLAVANKLKAALNRNTRAQQNVQNSISFLQVQDGALKTSSQILDRMSELKTMSLDVTKNAADIANYQAEFGQLQSQLQNVRDEKFNGINVFTTAQNDLTIYTTEIGKGTITTAGVTAVAQTATTTITGGDTLDTFNVDIDGNALAAAVVWRNDVTDTAADLVTAINADATLGALVTASSAAGVVTLTAATAGTGFTQGATAVADISTSGVVAATDAAGTTNGAGVTEAGDAPSMAMSRHHLYQTGAVGSGMVTAGNEDLLVKTNELSAFSVDELTTMIQNAATARAENGAQSQRLNWSSDMLAVNYTNVEAAHSRLSDVDFATESTRFAKNNILLQSAAAMLSQANSLPSVALQLLQ
jgi:flagellin-like hook-associated protein FlgL